MSNIYKSIKRRLSALAVPKPEEKIKIYLAKYLDINNSISMVDIGAHRGDFINQVKKSYRIEKAVLIEPIPELAGYLKSVFNDTGIRIYQNAVSDKDFDPVEFQINEYAETSSLLEFNTGMKELANVNTRFSKKEIVVSRTLDSIVRESEFGKIDLIKIDVQGAEHMVLNGAVNSLQVTRFIWVELSFKPLYAGSPVFQDIYSLMEKNDFILLEISPGHRSQNNELLQADVLFANPKYL